MAQSTTNGVQAIQAVQAMVKHDIGAVGNDVVAADAWMGVYGLLDHIQQTIAFLQNGTTNQDTASAIESASYLAHSLSRYAVHFYRRFGQLYDADPKTAVQAEDDAKTRASKRRQRIYWRHQALEVLCLYWERIKLILFAAADPEVNLLSTLIRAADPERKVRQAFAEQRVKDIGVQRKIDTTRLLTEQSTAVTIPYYSAIFELVDFEFAPDLFIIGIPVFDVSTPWNWQVAWHEIATLIVRDLREKGVIKQFLDRALNPTLDFDAIWVGWEQHYRPVAPARSRHSAEFEALAANKSQLGQANRPLSEHEESPEDFLWKNVRREEWLEQMIEDAYSAVVFGPEIIHTLDRILSRYVERDDTLRDTQHPPLKLRKDLLVAVLLEVGVDPAQLREEEALAERLQSAEAMRPVAQGLMKILADEIALKSYVYSLSEAEQRIAELGRLFTETGHATSVSVEDLRYLIIASRRAVVANPTRAEEIAALAKQVVQRVEAEPPKTKAPDDAFLISLTSSAESWSDLLHQLKVNIDPVWGPQLDHTHNGGGAWVAYWAYHNNIPIQHGHSHSH